MLNVHVLAMTGSHAFPVCISLSCRDFDSRVYSTTFSIESRSTVLNLIFVTKIQTHTEWRTECDRISRPMTKNQDKRDNNARKVLLTICIKLNVKEMSTVETTTMIQWWNPYIMDILLSLIRGKLIIITNSYSYIS